MPSMKNLLLLIAIVVPVLVWGQKDKEKFKPDFKIGLQSQFGYSYRRLKPVNEISNKIIPLRNQNEKGFFTSRIEGILTISNKKLKWIEYEFGIGYEYFSPKGLQIYYFDPPYTYGKKTYRNHHFLHIRNGVNFVIGKKRHKFLISSGANLSIYVRKKYGSNERENSKTRNVSPFISSGYRYCLNDKFSFSIQAYFNSQILDNNEAQNYSEITGYYGPVGSGQNFYPIYEYHKPEQEFYWQAGLKFTFLFEFKRKPIS